MNITVNWEIPEQTTNFFLTWTYNNTIGQKTNRNKKRIRIPKTIFNNIKQRETIITLTWKLENVFLYTVHSHKSNRSLLFPLFVCLKCWINYLIFHFFFYLDGFLSLHHFVVGSFYHSFVAYSFANQPFRHFKSCIVVRHNLNITPLHPYTVHPYTVFRHWTLTTAPGLRAP